MNQNISLQNGELVTILTNQKEQKRLPFISLRWILLAGYAVAGIIPLLLLASTMLHSVQGYFVEERKKELEAQNEMSGLMFKMENDPRIFPVGKRVGTALILRRGNARMLFERL